MADEPLGHHRKLRILHEVRPDDCTQLCCFLCPADQPGGADADLAGCSGPDQPDPGLASYADGLSFQKRIQP